MSSEERKAAWQQLLHGALEERFQLKSHTEMREMPIYALTLLGTKPRFHESTATNAGADGDWSGGLRENGGMTITGRHVSISQLAHRLTGYIGEGRLVVDDTGLTGRYDFTLSFAYGDSSASGNSEGESVPTASEPAGISIFVAVERQLGLKLTPTKGPVKVIVIDHLEHPSAN